MTELDVILADIRTNPADDLPRLALADWLMEQGDPASQARGEFIHVRCRAAVLEARDPERGGLQRRGVDLQEQFENAWLGGLAEYLEKWEFERGMILVGVSPRLLNRTAIDRLTATAGWKWVIGLRGEALKQRDLKTLFSSPYLTAITSLDLRDCEVARTGARALAASEHVGRIASLDLAYTQLGTEGLEMLAGSKRLPSLRILHLCNNAISAPAVQALAASPEFPQLERLDLSRNPIEDGGAIALAGAPERAGLRILRLASCGIRDRGGVALASSAHLAGLDLLDLSDNSMRKRTREELRERFGKRVVFG